MEIPDRMQALVLLQDGYASAPAGQDLNDLTPFVALQDLPVPQPGDGQALIRVARAAVNPSDVAFIKGVYGQPRRRGQPAGFEGTGIVVAGDTPLLGRRVSFFGAGAGSGTWADYALADAAGLIPLRDDLADADAAGLIVNPLTAMAMFDIARSDGAPGFVVTAAGSQLGKLLIALGAGDDGPRAIAVVRRQEQAAPLAALGAGEVLVTSDPDLPARRKAALAAHAPRVMLDAVADQVSADLFFAMPDGARWIIYGRLGIAAPRLTEIPQFIFRDKRIEGFWLAAWMRQTPADRVATVVADVQARFADGRWRTDITATLPLAEAMARLPAAYAAKDGKVLLAP